MFDISKIFNRDNNMIQIPLEHLCANELNLCYKKKGYPYLYTEAKVCMALYQRWNSLKNGDTSDFKQATDKENVKPETNVDEELQKEKIQKLREDFGDVSKPVVIENTEILKFLI